MGAAKVLVLAMLLAVASLASPASAQAEREGPADDFVAPGETSVDDDDEDIDDYDEDDSSEIKEENGVVILNDANFDTFVEGKDTVLLEFYAPWCGHCKQFAPEYEKIAQALKENDPPIPVAKIDATAASTVSGRFDVSGYPTIKILKKGQPVDYEGSRTEAGIVDYMIEQAGPPSKQIQAVKQVQEFVKDGDDVIIIGVFKGDQDPAYQLYQDAANNLREEFKFHHTFSNEISTFLKVDPGKLVVMQPEKFHSKYEPKMHVLDIKDSTDATEVKDHVVKHALPLVGHRKSANDAKRYTKKPLVVVYYTVDFSFDYRVATQYWRNKVLEVAKDFPEYTFAIADEEDYSSEIKDLGLVDSGEDVNAAIFDEGGKKYAMEPEEFDSDVLREFVVSFKKGKLKPIVKSQPVPKNNKGPVKIVVGKTFESIVMDPKTDVLIEFYAPWCGHCKKLEPIYTELGKKYKTQKNLVIAKMDATANDVTNENYKVEGFPTIYFAPSNKKKDPIKFGSGERDLESLSKFVEEYATKLSRTKEEL
ncbi:protein disulfide-isomerase A4 [Podarcis lilfordi]|uniref:Protein disulfide-isomerase n=1 Tax=Podarcis lilfordi TaxID=74358 RepID=A0AA35KDG2_9SAUR|nr:protein disulfide-isomerase A4 [Podarcis lilfordi]